MDSDALLQREPARALEDLAQTFLALSRDIVQTIVMTGGRSDPCSATIPRKGFEIVRDFTAENVSSSVRDVTYEKAVWPSAQEKPARGGLGPLFGLGLAGAPRRGGAERAKG